jgi:hypothetical protein
MITLSLIHFINIHTTFHCKIKTSFMLYVKLSSHGYSGEVEITYVPLLCIYLHTCLFSAVLCDVNQWYFISAHVVTILIIYSNQSNFSVCNNEMYISEISNLPHANVMLIIMAASECRKLAFVNLHSWSTLQSQINVILTIIV